MEHFVRVCREDKRMPYHRVPVDIAGHKSHAFLLTRIDPDNQARRDTLVLSNADEIIALLPTAIRKEWQSFSNQLTELRQKWGFHGIPTMKRALRLYREQEVLNEFDLLAIAHRFGAVPALRVGEVDEFNLALFSDPFGQGAPRSQMTEPELLELQGSLDEYLPLLFHAYFEQVSFYLRDIFFTAYEEQVLHFCLRIRTLVMASIRGKLDSIDIYPTRFRKLASLNESLLKKYPKQINEGRAVDCLAHMIVNYIYGAFCLKHRAVEYYERLQALPGESDSFEDSSIALMKRCGEAMMYPQGDGRFLHEISTHRQPREPWLKTLAEISAFVSEIMLSTGREYLDSPRIFLTYHFKTNDSEKIYRILKDLLQTKNAAARMVRGRHLGPDIRWSVLARLWAADYHMLALPSTWKRDDGKMKHLRNEGNWVNLELFYGQLIQKELRVITSEPVNDQLIEDFGRHLVDYTDAREIEQIDEHSWEQFLPVAKERLRTTLRNTQHLNCDISNLDEAFWLKLKKQVLDPAGMKLLHMLFHAWCYSFEPDDWSVVQAVIAMAEGQDAEFTPKEIAEYIQANVTDQRFEWAREAKSFKSLEASVRTRLKALAEFEFILSEGAFPILLLKKNPQRFRIRVTSAHKLLTRKFDLDYDPAELQRIFTHLSAPRRD
jgi:hypothetical protein